jgi:hypothetical protein
MAYSRQQFTQSFIVLKDKKTLTGYFSNAKMMLDKNLQKDKEVKPIREFERKLIKALGSGEKITVTYYNGTGFQKVTGYVQSYHPSERKVSIVHFDSQWSVRISDVVRIEE